LDAFFGQSDEDAVEGDLHVGESFWERGVWAEGIELAENLGGILLAAVITLMEVTEFLAAEGRGSAGGTIGLDVVTGRAGHKTSKKSIVSCQLSVEDNGQQSGTASMRGLCPHREEWQRR
jgi:hypothetical protein